MKRDLLSLFDLTSGEADGIFADAKVLKANQKKGIPYRPLAGKTLAMIFEKPSTRTRVSFEVGMFQLGGQSIFLDTGDIQMARGESIKDTARTLSRYVDGILMRGYHQEDLEEMARFSDVPVINGLTDLLHPCQILGDIFTIIEKKGSYKEIVVAYIGDGNNVANSWIEGAALLGFSLVIACPKSYPPSKKIIDRAKQHSANIRIVHDPVQAVKGADVVSTDVWVSMGQESQGKKGKAKAFKGFRVDSRLMGMAKKDAIVMHCLPAHRGEEITEEVLEGASSAVFDQAENRLHVQKAILKFLIV